MLVELHDCIFGYGARPVVQVDQLCLHPGRCVGVFGPNGAGKTTLVRGITGLLAPIRGTISRDRAARIGYLPQLRSIDTHWPMTALDAATMAISARSPLGWVSRAHSQVQNSMHAMDVADLASRPFAKLSGGQQQRVLLAGALAAEPQILVLDEPTEGLDVRSRQSLLTTLRDEVARGLCAVMISHEVEDLLALAGPVAWLHPPVESTQPSTVEVIAADQLAERVSRTRWQS